MGAAFLDEGEPVCLASPLLWLPLLPPAVVGSVVAESFSRPAVMVMTFMPVLRSVSVTTVLPGGSLPPGGLIVVHTAESWGISSEQLASRVPLQYYASVTFGLLSRSFYIWDTRENKRTRETRAAESLWPT